MKNQIIKNQEILSRPRLLAFKTKIETRSSVYIKTKTKTATRSSTAAGRRLASRP